MRKITIEPAWNGWRIKIGCAKLVAENKQKMLDEIGRYIDDPEKVEKEYASNRKNTDESPECETGREEAERPVPEMREAREPG